MFGKDTFVNKWNTYIRKETKDIHGSIDGKADKEFDSYRVGTEFESSPTWSNFFT